MAIIAALVAIAIPMSTAQLGKARETTDAANIRSAYAEISASYLTANDPGKIDNIVVNGSSNSGAFVPASSIVAPFPLRLMSYMH